MEIQVSLFCVSTSLGLYPLQSLISIHIRLPLAHCYVSLKKKKKSTLWVAKLGREKLEEWPHFQVYLSWQAERGQYFLSTCLLALWAVHTLQRPQFKFILMTSVHNFLFIQIRKSNYLISVQFSAPRKKYYEQKLFRM